MPQLPDGVRNLIGALNNATEQPQAAAAALNAAIGLAPQLSIALVPAMGAITGAMQPSPALGAPALPAAPGLPAQSPVGSGAIPSQNADLLKTRDMYNLDNIQAAMRNALRESGVYYNRYNSRMVKNIEQYANAAVPQFLDYLASNGGGDMQNTSASLKDFMLKYVNGMMGGGGDAVLPWSYSQAQTGMNRLAALAQQQQQADFDAFQRTGKPAQATNALQKILGDMLARDPENMAGMMASAFQPSLGPGLGSSFGSMVRDAYNDYSDFVQPGQYGATQAPQTWADYFVRNYGFR